MKKWNLVWIVVLAFLLFHFLPMGKNFEVLWRSWLTTVVQVKIWIIWKVFKSTRKEFGLVWFFLVLKLSVKVCLQGSGQERGKACEPPMVRAVLLTFFQSPSCMVQKPLRMTTTAHKYLIHSLFVLLFLRKGVVFQLVQKLFLNRL